MKLLQNLRFVLFALILAAGAGVIWTVRAAGKDIPAAFAQSLNQTMKMKDFEVGDSVRAIDGQVAGMIRTPSGLNLNNLNFSLPQAVTDATNSTISATFATTPAEFWQNLREKGAQEAVSTVVTQAQLQAGEVSADIVNEARYQYCKGVVTAYESAPKKTTP